jgi:hypothetical protein
MEAGMRRTLIRVIGVVSFLAGWTLTGAADLQVLAQGAGAAAPAGAQDQGPAGRAGQAPGGGGGRAGGRGGRGGGPPGPPPTAQASATVDLTGYWVSLVTEDWRWRMKVPDKGDVSSIPVTQAARDAADAWDPAKDEAEGTQCKAYGAAAIMRVPTRVHITWQDPNTLKLEADAGTQTRLFRFGEAAVDAPPGERTWQGVSVAEWEPQAGGGRGGRGGRGGAFPGGPGGAPPGRPGGPGGAGPAGGAGAVAGGRGAVAVPPDGDAAPPAAAGRGAAPQGPAVRGALKVVTTNTRPGYLRRNGVPYGEKAVVTEYFHRTPETYGVTYLIVTTIVEDPEYLTAPFITSSHFKKLPDTATGWDPTPCSVN